MATQTRLAIIAIMKKNQVIMDNWRPNEIQCYYGCCWCRLGMYSLSRLCQLRTASLLDLGWDWRYQTYNRSLSYSWPWSRYSFGLRYWTVSIAERGAWRKGTGLRPCLLRLRASGNSREDAGPWVLGNGPDSPLNGVNGDSCELMCARTGVCLGLSS
jgi:hypothetical protein